MIRIFWIVGLSITLLMFTGFAALCVIALITRNHFSLKAWTMLLFMSYGARFLFISLRSAIRYGDPTAKLGHGDAR